MEFILANPLMMLNVCICSALFYHAVCMLNSRQWPWKSGYAWGYKLLALGSFAVVVGPLYGYTSPQPAEVISNLGVAVILGAMVWRRIYRSPKDEDPS